MGLRSRELFPRMELDAAVGGVRHVDAGDTVMVGDTVFDIQMARNAQVQALGVSWGYHETEELSAAGAARVIDSFTDLLPALQALDGARP